MNDLPFLLTPLIGAKGKTTRYFNQQGATPANVILSKRSAKKRRAKRKNVSKARRRNRK